MATLKHQGHCEQIMLTMYSYATSSYVDIVYESQIVKSIEKKIIIKCEKNNFCNQINI